MIESLLSKAHAARMEVWRIEQKMRACRCQHELAAEILEETIDEAGRLLFRDRSGERYNLETPERCPCWKGEWVVTDPWGGSDYETAGVKRGGWCSPCRKRQDIRKNLEPARRRLAGLKSAIWAAAKKCAENSP